MVADDHFSAVQAHPAQREHSTRCLAGQTSSGDDMRICSASQRTFLVGL